MLGKNNIWGLLCWRGPDLVVQLGAPRWHSAAFLPSQGDKANRSKTVIACEKVTNFSLFIFVLQRQQRIHISASYW